MNKEYKEVYDLVNILGFSPAYIQFKRGIYYLEVFSKDYSPLGKGKKYFFQETDLNQLKEQLKEELKWQ